MYDVTVIGGGPAGNKAASLLAEDHDVLVIEDHDVSGRPVQCAGLISDETYELSGVKPEILNSLYGANIFFPNGKKITIRSKERKAVLIDRFELDAKMAEKASDEGADHIYGARYESHRASDHVLVSTTAGEFRASVIVGADGYNSKVADSLGDNGPAEYVTGMQYDIKYRAEDQEMINIRLGSEIAPGFFSWEIPFGDMTRIGLCTSPQYGPPAGYLRALMRRTGLDGYEIMNRYSGKIPLGGRRTTYGDHLLLLGDAAGQVKPVSGGGLQPAFRSSYALAETIREAFDESDLSKEFLSVYEKRWKRDIGKEMRRGYRLRRMFVSLSDGELNKVQRITEKDGMAERLASGNIDHPSDLLFPTARNIAAAARLAPLMLKAMLR